MEGKVKNVNSNKFSKSENFNSNTNQQHKTKMYLPIIIPTESSPIFNNNCKPELFRTDSLNLISNFQPYRKLFMDVLKQPIGCFDYHKRTFNCPDLEENIKEDMDNKIHAIKNLKSRQYSIDKSTFNHSGTKNNSLLHLDLKYKPSKIKKLNKQINNKMNTNINDSLSTKIPNGPNSIFYNKNNMDLPFKIEEKWINSKLSASLFTNNILNQIDKENKNTAEKISYNLEKIDELDKSRKKKILKFNSSHNYHRNTKSQIISNNNINFSNNVLIFSPLGFQSNFKSKNDPIKIL